MDQMKLRQQRNGKTMIVLLILTVLINILSSSDACYIKNCPLSMGMGKRGSKNIGADNLIEGSVGLAKMCPKCGPNGVGRCLGPYTCCTADGGCMMGTNSMDTEPCFREQSNPIPCIFDQDADRCGQNGEGVCASNAVCCTEDTCTLSSECESKKKTIDKMLRD